MRHLKELVIDNNKNLPELHVDMFKMSSELNLLSVVDCRLKYFPNDTFRWLPNLERLILSGNHLTYINLTYCPQRDYWLALMLTRNRIHALTNETFRFTCKCFMLYLNDNPLKIVDPRVIAPTDCLVNVVGTELLSASDYSVRVYEDIFLGFAQSSANNMIGLKFGGKVKSFTLPDNFFDPLVNKTLKLFNFWVATPLI